MSNETLGIRVDLTGNKEAVDGLQNVTAAEKSLADATSKINAANKDAKTSGDALNTTISQTATSSTRGGEALREMEARSRSLASSQQNVAASMANGVAQTGMLAQAGGVLASIMGAVATASVVMGTALAVAAPAAAFGAAQDEARVLLSRITQITGSLNESRAVYRGLTDDAIRLRVGLNDTLSGYTRISMAVKELGGTSTQARALNEMVIGTAKVMGVTAQEAAAAARQFAQALGSGVLQGDELRSILENNQELARQLAAGLGVSIGSLRKMGEEGKLTADVVATALLSRLPEMRAKLAEVPLTSADAWQKLSTVLGAWIVQGDSVEMKAGLIARSMNAIAEGIERARKAAAAPITVTVREVYETQGGAAFIGPNLGRRDPTAIAAETQVAINAENTRRASHVAAIRAADNDIVVAGRLGLELAAKKAIEDAEKYADSVALGSAKIQKSYDKEMKGLTAKRAELTKALTSGDPASYAIATAALQKLAEQELAFTTDMQRKLAEAKKTEANKGNAEMKAAQANAYREAIAQQEAFQTTIEKALADESATLKREYEARKISAQEYYSGLASIRLIALAQQEESVRQELAVATAAVARGDASKKADVAKYLSELQRFAATRIKIAEETEDAISAIEKRAREERERATAEANQRFNEYITGSAELVRAMQAENEQRQFELSLVGQSLQSAATLQANRQAELNVRRQLTQAYREYIAAMNASDSQSRDNAITDAYNKQIAAIRAAGDEQANLTVQVQATGTAYQQMSSFVDGFINAAMGGFKSLKDWLKNQLFDWLKQSLIKPFIMQIAASVTGGGGGGFANAAAQALGGGGGGAGSWLSTGANIVGMLGSIGSGITTIGSALGLTSVAGFGMGLGGAATLAGSTALSFGVAGASTGAAVGSAVAAGTATIGSAVTAVLAAIPVYGWIALAVIAAAAYFGGDETGIKIDNNTNGVGNPSSHFVQNPLAAYDVSGDLPTSTFAALIKAVNKYDEILVDALLSPAQTAAIRAKLGSLINPDWFGFEDDPAEAIGKASKDFLQTRYGAVFDEVDAKIAATVRTFAGGAEELLKYIGEMIAVMQLLSVNASDFTRLIGEPITLSSLSAVQAEGETLAQTLTRVVNVFTVTNGVASLMGKDVTTAFGAVGMASLAARQNLIDLAGGMQSLDQLAGDYYSKYYTEAERNARSLAAAGESVSATFAELDIAVPTSRAAFRALVEAQDLSTDAGRKTWVALMKVAGAFDAISDKTETAAARLDRAGLLIDQVIADTYGSSAASPSMGPGAPVNVTAALKPSTDFLNGFLNAAQREAYRLAESTRQVADAFSRADVILPKTRDEYLRLAYAQDLSTERGRQVYQMLMDNAQAFADLTASGVAASQFMENLTPSASLGQGEVVAATMPTTSTEFLAMMSDAQREAYQLAESTRVLAQAFARVDVAVPDTVQGYIALAQAQDLTTARGREVYQMLMDNAGAFTALHASGSAVQPTDQYLAEFFTETQVAAYRLARAQYEVATAFDKMGLAAPTTREQFVALVNSMDQSTESGRAFVAALMAIAPAFAAATPKPASAVEATDQYLANFFTETQVAAYRLAQAQRQVNEAFTAAGIAVPATREQFVALVNSFDQTTEYGRGMVAMLMGIAPAFAAATTAISAAITTISYQVGDLLSIGSGMANDAWTPIATIIDGGTQSLAVRLAAKMQQAEEQAARFDALAKATAEGDDAHRLAFEAARDQMLAIRAGLAGNLALLATVTAQYGSAYAEQMYELEIWHNEQIAAAHGNAALLLLIEQTYADRRNAILTGGVASGLNSLSATIQAWINNLLLNDRLSTLTPQQRLMEAQQQYNAALTSGDASRITGAADAYLREARSFYASSAEYTTIFAQVLAQLRALAVAPVIPPTPVAVPRPANANSGSVGGGNGGAVAAKDNVRASENFANAAATSARAANDALGMMLAEIKYAVDANGDAQRESDSDNTDRLIAAVAAPGAKRVAV